MYTIRELIDAGYTQLTFIAPAYCTMTEALIEVNLDYPVWKIKTPDDRKWGVWLGKERRRLRKAGMDVEIGEFMHKGGDYKYRRKLGLFVREHGVSEDLHC
jgi:hypothetical protein